MNYLLFEYCTIFIDNFVFKDLFNIQDDDLSRVDNLMKLLDVQQDTKLLFWLGLVGFLVIYVFVKKYGIRSKYRKS